MDSGNHVVMGRVGKSHGVSGWMKIHAHTEPASNLLGYQPWFLDGKPLRIEATRETGDVILAKFEGCDDPETVQAHFTNRLLMVSRAKLPETGNDEYYWQDLMGCQVYRQDESHALGEVNHLMRTPGNDVLVVRAAGKNHLIPWTKAAVLDVNTSDKRIVVAWNLAN